MTLSPSILSTLAAVGRGLPNLRAQAGPGHPLVTMFLGDDDLAVCVVHIRLDIAKRPATQLAPMLLATALHSGTVAVDESDSWDDATLLQQATVAAATMAKFVPVHGLPHLKLVAGARDIAFGLVMRIDSGAPTAISFVFDHMHEMNANLAHTLGGAANFTTKLM